MNIQALIDKAVDQIIKSVQVMIQKVRKESTKIYNGIVVSNNGDGRWNVRYNGEVHAVRLYGETPPMIDSTVKVFVPQGNQNLAWFIIPPIEGGGGGSGTSGVDSFNGRTGTVIGIAGDYTAAMVGTRPNTWLPTPDEIGAVPESTTVNGKSLSSNITLQASDVGAVPTSRTVNGQALNNDVTLTGSNIAASANDSTTIAAALSNKADISITSCYKSGINAGTDMNNIDVIGVYQIGSSAHVPEILNLPSDYGPRAGVCVVAKETQVLYSYGDNGSIGTAAWMRSFYLKSEVRYWTDWVRISTATPPEEFNLPLVEGVSANQKAIYYKTQEGIVHLEVYVSGEIQSGIFIIGNLPEGFRPKYECRSTVNSNLTPYATGSSLISPSGEVKTLFSSAQTRANIVCSFLAAD